MKETPEEYRARKERQQREYEERQRKREQKQREYEARKTERERKQAQAASTKRNLITKAQAYQNSTDWKQAGKVMASLMDEWKSVGRAGDEESSLWSSFDSARQTFYDRRSAYFAQRDREYAACASAKKALVARAKSLAITSVNSHNEAKSLSSSIKGLWSEWSQIGYAGKEERDLKSSFKNSLSNASRGIKSFYDAYNREKEKKQREFDDARRAKENLLAQMSRIISKPDDYKGSRTAFSSLCAEWHKTGYAGKDNKSLGARFKSLKDKFYSIPKSAFSNEKPRLKVNSNAPKVMEYLDPSNPNAYVWKDAGPEGKKTSGHQTGKRSKKDTDHTTFHPDGRLHQHGSHAKGKKGEKKNSHGHPERFLEEDEHE